MRTHPVTGRQGLYVNRGFTLRIPQLRKNESDALLEMLYRHIETPEFQCRFKWQANSVAFWDNRCAQHHAMFDYFPHRRYGHRVTVCGDKPFYRAALMRRRCCRDDCLLGAALAAPFPARAEAWPAKPIRVILPGPAGGLIDVAGRAIGEAMQKELGQPWLIDPRPGANGIMAGQMFLGAAGRRLHALSHRVGPSSRCPSS